MDSPNGDSSMGDNEKQRDRGRRGERGTRFSDKDESRDRSRERHGGGNNKRVYVSNIPYEFRWQDLKDLFRRLVGNVEYVEMFTDENGKARGVGIVEFKDPENVGKALEVMNRYQLQGRELVVKEDHGEERDKFGRIARGSGMGGGGGGGGDSRGGGVRRSQGGGGGMGGGGRDRDDGGYLLVLLLFLLLYLFVFLVLVLSSYSFRLALEFISFAQNEHYLFFFLAFSKMRLHICHWGLTLNFKSTFSF